MTIVVPDDPPVLPRYEAKVSTGSTVAGRRPVHVELIEGQPTSTDRRPFPSTATSAILRSKAPAVAARPTVFEETVPPRSTPDAPDTVLVVDDHPGAREVISRMLIDGGFAVVSASSGAAAIAQLGDVTRTIDAIVTDVSMPDMTGVELAYYVREHYPSLPIAIVSGDIGDLERSVIARAGVPFLKKPVRAEALQTAIREAMRAVRG